MQNVTTTPAQWYGLEFSEVIEETVPLFIESPKQPHFDHGDVLNRKKVKLHE